MLAKFRKMLVSADEWEEKVAILEDGEICEVYIGRKGQQSIVGNIYLGKVQNVLKGIGSAFVNIGLKKNGFLYLEDNVFSKDNSIFSEFNLNNSLKANQKILVQGVKDPKGPKGAKITTQIALPGRFLVLLPTIDFIGISRKIDDEEIRNKLYEIGEKIKPERMGLIFRTISKDAETEDFVKDLKYLFSLWDEITFKVSQAKAPSLIYKELNRIIKIVRDIFSSDFSLLYVDQEEIYREIISFLDKVSPELKERVHLKKDENLFEKYGVNSEIENILKKEIWLRSGGYITIDSTEALTAIDVNTGKYVGVDNSEETILKTNIEAAQEIVRQIRLRDTGGIIVIDFIGMKKSEHKEKVFEVFNKVLLSDRAKVKVTEISSLGLVEMTRQSIGEGLLNLFLEPCPQCKGTGYILRENKIAKV